MEQIASLGRESASPDGRVEDPRIGMGDEVEVFVPEARLMLLERAEIRLCLAFIRASCRR